MGPSSNVSAAREKYYSQLFLIYYRIYHCWPKAIRYSIGRKIRKYSCFNDVLLKIYREQSCSVYLFEIENLRYRRENGPDYGSLGEAPPTIAYNLQNYFKTYLRMRADSSFSDCKFVVLVNSEYDVDRFEHNPNYDIVQCSDSDFDETDVIKYRIVYNSNIAKEILKHAHPLWGFARRISRMLFKNIKIGSKTFPHQFYDVLLRDVFENESFRECFLQDSPTLGSEAKVFREYLEEILQHKFRRRNLDGFALSRINQEQFAKHINIRLSHTTNDDRYEDPQWDVDCPATNVEVEQFLVALVFHVPTQATIDKISRYELSRFYKRGIWLHSSEINLIFKMIELKRWREDRSRQDIRFKWKQMDVLGSTLRNFCSQTTISTLLVEACADLNVTVDRIQDLLNECKLSTNIMILNDEQYRKNMKRLSQILHILGPKMEEELILIVAVESPKKDYIRAQQLTAMRCPTIFVVPKICSNIAVESMDYHDQFSFNDLANCTMHRMLSKVVLLQGRQIHIKDLLDKDLFSRVSSSALLDWNNSERIIIATEQYPELLENFIKRDIRDEFGNSVNLFEKHLAKVVVLCGPPGMGKTAILSEWCKYLFEAQSDCLIISKDAKAVIELFCEAEHDFENVLKLLGIKQLDGIQRFIVEELIKEGRVCLFLDGFDEISDSCQQHCNSLLRFVNNADFRLIVITTRLERLRYLKHHLNEPMICYVQPISEEDQSKLLRNNSRKCCSNEDQITDLLYTFKRMFDKDEGTGTLLGVPLQTAIVASIIDECRTLTNHPNIAELVQLFINKTFDIYVRKYFDPTNRAHEIASKILRATFETKHAEVAFIIEINRKVAPNQLEDLQQFGLLRLESDRIIFSNSALSEYFLVQYLLMHFVEQHYFNHILANRLSKSNTNWFDAFLDHCIKQTDPLRKLIGYTSLHQSDFSEFRNTKDSRIHLDKTKQFHLYLKTNCTDQQVYHYLRDATNRAAFNVFEVLFDSLPIALAQRLRFKFISCDHDPAMIDLSTISDENCLVQILSIFGRKQSAKPLQMLITNPTLNEPDFVENAVVKNYVRVIDQLFDFERSITDQEARNHLHKYYDSRWRQYFRLIVLRGKSDIVQHMTQGLEKRFDQKLIRRFLMTENVLRELILVSVDAESSAAEVIRRLIDIFKQYLNDNDINILTKRIHNGQNYSELNKCVKNKQIQELIFAFTNLSNNYQK
ncbi:uncharacterized protein LOC129778297 [Toxorhynchites rutilus septentrionalis]|uniref:uncharacterized protein LOC129778297 n=1 Tax=Toxorhynchites rutilus septentrionalis TaxID=329112 RepID=UPI00247AACA7|nr:uncharacterized protein LOC129778297 [Toxorhynchites rutilus septentrionalis]XP_055641083.1 uncharacterized protein LOC129778297 [Toxorhynchites rutilus septentrionalis]XP_055641084.1 uncharacterized protein LOC129778297 [Toxorhynchites rutilus septentrionalis]